MKSLILSTVLLFSLHAIAQKSSVVKQKPKFTVEQRAELKSKQMALRLDLDKKQTEQVKALQLERIKQREAKQKARKNEVQSGIKPTSDELFKRKSAMLDEQIAYQNKMKSILSEEQYKQWKLIQKRYHKKKSHKKTLRDK